MAAKELRLAFAMGGGVSLGTFSGAALSEAIKAAVLGAGYVDPATGQRVRYSRVVVDVFSGASAGAMSLAVMLRALAHRTPQQAAAAEVALRREIGDAAFDGLGASVRADLIAAQVVQTAQETIWRDEVHIQHLLGAGPDGKRDLSNIGSIFDRGEVDRIARKFLLFGDSAILNPGEADPKKRRADLSGRRLLGDRVLLACTISNLSAVKVDAAAEFLKGNVGMRGLADGAASNVHSELRVFDLRFRAPGKEIDPNFADPTRNPRRWCRYHEGDQVSGSVGDLRLVRTWKKIAATAIASGAFPFAFEPVVLSRSQFEFGPEWPQGFERAPEPFDPAAGRIPEFTFSYVDGGTFNNEPIREAFRLSAFADAGSMPDSFDRLVVFVDPFADASAPALRVPVHREYFFQDPNFLGKIDGFDLERSSSLDRLLPHMGTVLKAIMDESRVNEANRISKTVNRFEQRSAMRAALLGPLTARADRAAMVGLREFCDGMLAKARENALVPPGRMSLEDELDRVILEDGLRLPRDEATLMDVCTRADPEKAADAGVWQQALASVALDLVMDMTGKSSAGRLIAITPLLNPEDPEDEPIGLPGGALQGFAGFCSKVNRDYEIRLGKLCTRRIMEGFGVLQKPAQADPLPKFSNKEREAFTRDLKIGIDAIGGRVSRLMSQSHIIQILPGLDNMVLWFVGNYLKKKLKEMAEPPSPTMSFEFRIRVPDSTFELDGRGILNDVKPVRIPEDGPRYLITFGQMDGAGKWKGPNFDEAAQVLKVDINGSLWGSFCSIELPRRAECVAADGHPNPRFELELDKAADKGKRIGRKRWVVDCGVKSLEEVL